MLPEMLKASLVVILSTWCLLINAQSAMQSKAIYEACLEAEDPNNCYYNFLQNKIVATYDNEAIGLLHEIHGGDTISLSSSIAINYDGTVDMQNSCITSCDAYIDVMNNDIIKSLKKFTLPKDKTGNFLSEMKRQNLYFSIVIADKDTTLTPLPFNEDYQARNIGFASIEQVPVYAGCEDASNQIQCFQQQILEHIKFNFRYPAKAQRKKISGRVNVMFIIDKEGKVSQVRTFGADPILMDEARRIVSLIPRMQPGMNKGKPVRVPFAIPITFALR